MPSYRYVAIGAEGALNFGHVTGNDEAGAAAQLEQGGLQVVRLERSSTSRLTELLQTEISIGGPISQKELALIITELGTLLEAGVTLDAALLTLRDLASRRALKQVIDALLRRVREGASLSVAMRAQPKVFDENVRAPVEAAERTGQLAKTLRDAGEQLQRAVALRSTIISSLYYPMILLVTAIVAIVFVFSVILPQFEPIFAAAGHNLPPVTQLVRAIGAGITGYYWVAIVIGAATVSAYAYTRVDANARLARDRLLLRLPLLGRLLVAAEMARLSRLLGSQLGAGVPIESALALTERSMRNSYLRGEFAAVREHVKNGERMGLALKAARGFPGLMSQLVSIGEESGNLDSILIRAAELFEANLRVALERTVALMTPLVTLILGLVVGTIIFAVLSAIMAVNQLV